MKATTVLLFPLFFLVLMGLMPTEVLGKINLKDEYQTARTFSRLRDLARLEKELGASFSLTEEIEMVEVEENIYREQNMFVAIFPRIKARFILSDTTTASEGEMFLRYIDIEYEGRSLLPPKYRPGKSHFLSLIQSEASYSWVEFPQGENGEVLYVLQMNGVLFIPPSQPRNFYQPYIDGSQTLEDLLGPEKIGITRLRSPVNSEGDFDQVLRYSEGRDLTPQTLPTFGRGHFVIVPGENYLLDSNEDFNHAGSTALTLELPPNEENISVGRWNKKFWKSYTLKITGSNYPAEHSSATVVKRAKLKATFINGEWHIKLKILPPLGYDENRLRRWFFPRRYAYFPKEIEETFILYD